MLFCGIGLRIRGGLGADTGGVLLIISVVGCVGLLVSGQS